MKRVRTSLLLTEWPAKDQALWQAANSTGGFLAPNGKAAHWKNKTRKGVVKRYSLWLGYLSSTDQLDPDKSPCERITEETLAGYVHWLEARGNASTTVSSCVRDIYEALRVMDPDANHSVIKKLMITLHARETPVRAKHTRILHPDDLLSGALAFLDDILNREFYNEASRAGKYRDGLIVAFLACRPIRLGNLSAITLGQHLIQDGERWICQFEASEMKDHCSISFSFPDRLIPYLQIYLGRYRPLLLKGNGFANLWISARGTPMKDQSVYCNTCSMTEKLFGRELNPHLFRDCAASALATDDPEHILAIARILGHASINTTQRHYNQSQMIAATVIYHQVMKDLMTEEYGL